MVGSSKHIHAKSNVAAFSSSNNINDENACPNYRSPTRSSAAGQLSSSRQSSRSKAISPKVAKLAARYEVSDNTQPCTIIIQQQLQCKDVIKVHQSPAFLQQDERGDCSNRSGLKRRYQSQLIHSRGSSVSNISMSVSESISEPEGRRLNNTDGIALRKVQQLNVSEVKEEVSAIPQQHVLTPKTIATDRAATARSITVAIAKDDRPSICKTTNSAYQLCATAIPIISQLILLLLSLYEVQHDYHITATTIIFDAISEIAGWSGVFHICFVMAFGIRGIISAVHMTRRRMSVKKNTAKGVRSLQAVAVFLFITSCWMILLPIFNTHHHFFVGKLRSSQQQQYVIKVYSPRYSLLDLVTKSCYKKIKFFIKSKIKGRVLREIQRALFRPFTIHGKLKKLFTIIRWSKFIAPLVGTCNKFRGHILDMIQKKQQHKTSKKAQQRWNEVLDAISHQSKLERAVLKLQKCFRTKQELKAQRRFQLTVRTTATTVSAIQIRKRLVKEQQLSRSKIERIELLHNERRIRRQVSVVERQSITEHRHSTRQLKKRLLLSPNTSFAVSWKYLTVGCVALEILQIIFAPILSGELKKMPLDIFLLKVFNASSCCDGKGSTSSTKVPPPSIFIPVINNLSDITCTSLVLKQIWLVTAHIISTAMVPVVNTIFFLDVFITFFTGELTSVGKLVPKPFFTRYILPGIGLQLVVNPTMLQISQAIQTMGANAIYIGPSLCYHLLLATLPFGIQIYDQLLDVIFDFVERQNRRCKEKTRMVEKRVK